MNHGWTYRNRVVREDAGKTIVQYYATRYPHSGAAVWRERIVRGEVERNGKRAVAGDVVFMSDELLWHRPPWEEENVPTGFSIVYEDEDLVAVDKPSGLPVQPGGGFLEHTLLFLLAKHYGVSSLPDARAPSPVHRLGRGTSGLVLFARSALARAALCAQFRSETAHREGLLEKRYLARTISLPYIKAGEVRRIETPIGRVAHPLLGTVYAVSPDGKSACSEAKVLEATPDSMLWDVQIFSGRPHQIRIHLSSIGAPLLGDPLYLPGGLPRPDVRPGELGYFLRAHVLSFLHPRTQQRVRLTIPAQP